MINVLLNKIFGSKNERELKRLQPLVAEIGAKEPSLARLSDLDLRAKADEFKKRLADGATLDDILTDAFAVCREMAKRKLEMRHFDVQLIGGMVLHEGKISEMKTGEGKTLVATLALYLNALDGKGAHLVTVNDYLAKRDAQWMGPLYHHLGLSVGVIQHEASFLYDPTYEAEDKRLQHLRPCTRQEAYRADITYGTNNEFGFDYLRDNMVGNLEQRVQRGHVYAIIDEVDSILIDEARTPLIISGAVGTESDEKYAQYNTQVVQLVRKQTAIANDLIARAEPLLANPDTNYEGAKLLYKAQLGMPKNKKLLKLLNEQGVKQPVQLDALHLLFDTLLVEQGVKQQVQRVELDRLADRKLPARDQKMRDVEDDLYFVMDERGRSVHLTDKGVETMSPQDPTLFVVPDISHAVHEIDHDETLTAKEKVERRRVVESEYAQKSETLHIIHKLLQAHALYEKDVEYVVQDGQVLIVDEFTGRLMHGRRWSDGLHQAVEAKEGVAVREENQTLATITIQNYFRMYQKLAGMTGTAETEEREFWEIYKLDVMVIPTNRPVRRIDKHDLIYKTRREKYNAIMDEIERQHQRGLPVLVGTVSVDVSETLSRMIKRRGLKHEVLNAKQHQREAEIVAQAGQPGSITIATNMAGRGTDIKLGPGVKKCQVCGITSHEPAFGQQVEQPDLTQPEIKKLGCYDDPPCGLVIIGTERHEARRIDRQLRGRSGRQGDPGQSVFFLALEDDLMRLFGSDRIARWMDRTGAEEGEVITHPWVTGAIGQAQKRVELQHFQARKKLLEYDDVMNQQREVIYSLRQFALEGGEELKA